MLAIRKRHDSVKAFTAGAMAFAFGLTGAGAYVSGMLNHENLAFTWDKSSNLTQQGKTEVAEHRSDENGSAPDTAVQYPSTPISSAPAPAYQALAPEPPQTISSAVSTVRDTVTPGNDAGPIVSDPASPTNDGSITETVGGLIDPLLPAVE